MAILNDIVSGSGGSGGGGGPTITWANDLATSTDTSQNVVSLTGRPISGSQVVVVPIPSLSSNWFLESSDSTPTSVNLFLNRVDNNTVGEQSSFQIQSQAIGSDATDLLHSTASSAGWFSTVESNDTNTYIQGGMYGAQSVSDTTGSASAFQINYLQLTINPTTTYGGLGTNIVSGQVVNFLSAPIVNIGLGGASGLTDATTINISAPTINFPTLGGHGAGLMAVSNTGAISWTSIAPDPNWIPSFLLMGG